MLANLYLHYVLDLWVNAWRKMVAHGEMIVVRYADDVVLGSQYRDEAEKTRPIEFGRYAAERRAKRREGKPETFNF